MAREAEMTAEDGYPNDWEQLWYWIDFADTTTLGTLEYRRQFKKTRSVLWKLKAKMDDLEKQIIKGAKLLEECHKKLTKKHQTKIIYQLSAEQKGKLENNIKAYLFRFRDEEGIELDPNYITKKILKSIR